MKKITKKSLDELAKVMPPMSEQEQRSFIGGERYYSPSGVFLGKVGSSDQIRIVDDLMFQLNCGVSGFNQDPSKINIWSTSLNQASDATYQSVIRSIMADNGDIAPNMNIEIDYVGTYYMRTIRGFNNSGVCSVELRVNRSEFTNGNYYDLKSTLSHEYMHWSNPDRTGVTGSIQSEEEALKAQASAGDWKNASPEYKDMFRQRCADYGINLGGQ